MEEDNYVEKMKRSRGKSSAILTRYIGDHDKYPDKFFCFFEGEDYKYYRTRIIQYLGIDDNEIFHYDCNGKKEVLKVYDDLLYYNGVKKIFFIDKDFDEDINKENLYQTECYSIENYYVMDTTLKKFLSTEFELNINDDNFIKCIDDYIKRRDEFNKLITTLNAYIYYMRNRDMRNPERIKLPDDKEILNKFVICIGVDKIESKDIENICDIKTILKDDREINEKEIVLLSNKFEKIDKKEEFYRGKFQIYFLKKFVSNLILQVNKNNYFKEYEKKITLDINSNTISFLSTYAYTSEKLKEFLIGLKKKYNR